MAISGRSITGLTGREMLLVSTGTVIGGILGASIMRFLFSDQTISSSFWSKNEQAESRHIEKDTLSVGFSNSDAQQEEEDEDQLQVMDPYDPAKRKGYLSWDDYFMAIAFLSAQRSKDPNRQVGRDDQFKPLGVLYQIDRICLCQSHITWQGQRVGACLVSQSKVILGIGYNGFPRGCSDDELPWAKKSRTEDPLSTKYLYVCHAEINAILNTNQASTRGQRLYVTMFPCNECAKVIIQAGVAEVIYFVDKNKNNDPAYLASQKLLAMAGVKVWKHQPLNSRIVINYK